MIIFFFHQLHKVVKMMEQPAEVQHTVQFVSDGNYVYWLYVVKNQETVSGSGNSENVKQHPVYMETLALKV